MKLFHLLLVHYINKLCFSSCIVFLIVLLSFFLHSVFVLYYYNLNYMFALALFIKHMLFNNYTCSLLVSVNRL